MTGSSKNNTDQQPPKEEIEFGAWMPENLVKADADTMMLEGRLRRARIPQKYDTKNLETFHTTLKAQKEVRDAARAYVEYFKLNQGYKMDGLRLVGGVGSGKTHIAISILREVIRAGYTGLYCNVPEFLKKIRASYGINAGVTESELIDDTREPDLLVLDDLGVEGRVLDPVRDRSKWLCERIYLIINGRYETDKPILVTTNCDLEGLKEQFDQRTVSRLAEMTARSFPRFPDKDYRMAMMR